MTSLEALERIKNFDKTRNRSAIEYLLEQENTDTYFETVEKELKAFEFIKEQKMLSVFKDINGKCFVVFNTTAIEISQEEYDLLKEVLL